MAHSNAFNRYAFFSGFTFTTIAILLTQLPELTQINTQIMLFILTAILSIFLERMAEMEVVVQHCVNLAPTLPQTYYGWREKMDDVTEMLSWPLLCIALTVMYLAWNLFYLALASVFLIAIFYTYTYIEVKPFLEYRQKHPLIRK